MTAEGRWWCRFSGRRRPVLRKAGRPKAIVFVTGVPGAGKTLVGLNGATRHGERSDAAHAVFLLGNAMSVRHSSFIVAPNSRAGGCSERQR
jgi:hypothetical protein